MNSEADPEHDRHDVGGNSCFVGMMHDAWGWVWKQLAKLGDEVV